MTSTRIWGSLERRSNCHTDYRCVFCVPAATTLAMTAGLEPATSGVTGRRSDQLSYVTLKCDCATRSIAKRLLPVDLPATMVEHEGLEPSTPCLQSRCAANCANTPNLKPVHLLITDAFISAGDVSITQDN